jgi:hypothetical protein
MRPVRGAQAAMRVRALGSEPDDSGALDKLAGCFALDVFGERLLQAIQQQKDRLRHGRPLTLTTISLRSATNEAEVSRR